MRVGFTGTRNLGVKDIDVIRSVVSGLSYDDDVITGGCIGADAVVAEFAFGEGDDFLVHTVLPANHAQVDTTWRFHCHTHEQMPHGTTYRERNQRIVDLCDRLIAFAEFPEKHVRSMRSGTWQTIRMARAAGKPTEVHILREEWS